MGIRSRKGTSSKTRSSKTDGSSKEVQSSRRGPSLPSSSKDPPKPTSEDEKGLNVISVDSPHVRGTTLLKPIDYPGIHEEEKDEINDAIEESKQFGGDSDEYYDRLRLTGVPCGQGSISAGPVLQVISVRISKRKNNNKPSSSWHGFQIYGQISVTDDKGNTFSIYKRKVKDAELVSPEYEFLSLSDCPVAPVIKGNVKCSLTYKKVHVEIIKGNHNVDYSIEDGSGKEYTLEFGGEHGYHAEMVFTKIPFAVIARVITFLSDRPEKGTCRPLPVGTFEIHGKITANEVVCFDRPQNYPLEFKHGTRNGFNSRTVYALPIYSQLRFTILLYNGDQKIADDEIGFGPHGSPPRLEQFTCIDENYRFGIYLEWFLHGNYFDRKEKNWMDDMIVKWGPDIPPPTVQIDEPHAADRTLVEVFSVFVGGGWDSPPALHGSIVVQDEKRDKTFYIFARNENCPDKLSDERFRTVSLAWSDRWVVEKDFYMHFKLKDVDGNIVCRGYFDLCEYWDSCPSYETSSWYDRRLCSVIKGPIKGRDDYFVAVHYSVFKNGLRAKVTVKWNGHDSIVYGSVFAEYGGSYDYPSIYDKEYYRSIIFKRSNEECVMVKDCSEIPLSKSHVSAPSDCKELLVYVKLVVFRPFMANVSSDQCDEYVLHFKAGKSSKVLHFNNCGRITVEVELPKFNSVVTIPCSCCQ